MPGWFLEILDLSIPALQASEQLGAAVAARIAATTQEDYIKATRTLRRLAQPYAPIPPTLVRAKHAAWFEREGIPYVITTDETEPVH